jgi:hypothetical protein
LASSRRATHTGPRVPNGYNSISRSTRNGPFSFTIEGSLAAELQRDWARGETAEGVGEIVLNERLLST